MGATQTKSQPDSRVRYWWRRKNRVRGQLHYRPDRVKAAIAGSTLLQHSGAFWSLQQPYVHSAFLERQDFQQLVKGTLNLHNKGVLDYEDVSRILSIACADYAQGEVLGYVTEAMSDIVSRVAYDLEDAAMNLVVAGGINDRGRSRRK